MCSKNGEKKQHREAHKTFFTWEHIAVINDGSSHLFHTCKLVDVWLTRFLTPLVTSALVHEKDG